ncbi:hypothetical protein OQ496_07065 [Acetobacter suratthaniensis]|uniref:DUF937 domain-containing protein n=1 Tax=Acetobacter suratthaniensis TaxID=1502841 RepID=A0ABS3LPK7_9PROT|nr:hypothetical protein [Acetobacter suratthaniensis]MBO1329307.1 hypothetical protein [Acetobacter suratthaniensis]MCX2566213.1 hypothetical protein [Acetobacter suratthaniensis]
MTGFTAADSSAAIARSNAYTVPVDASARVGAVTPVSSVTQGATSRDTVVLSNLALEALEDLGATGTVSSTMLDSIVEAASRFTGGAGLLDALNTQRPEAVSLLQAMPQPTVSIGDSVALHLQATQLAGIEQMFSSGLGGGLVGNAQLFPALAEADAVSIVLQAIASEPSGTQGAQSGGGPVSQAGQTQAAVIASALQALVGTQASTEAAAVAVLLPALLETVALHDESFLSSIFLASGLRPSITLPGLLLSGSALSSVATALENALSGTELTDTQKATLLNAFSMAQAEGETGAVIGGPGSSGAAGGLYAPPGLYHPTGTNWPLYNQVSQGGLPVPEGAAELAASMSLEAVAYENAVRPALSGEVRPHDGGLYAQTQQGLPLSSLEEMGRTPSNMGDMNINGSLALAALMSGLGGGGGEMQAASFSNAMLNSTALTSVINAGWTVLLSGYQFRLYPPYIRRRRHWWRRLRVWRTSPADPNQQDDAFYGGGARSGGYTA